MLAPARRQLVEKLVRELMRVEQHAIDHAPLEERRLGESPPVSALREVAEHAASMRGRLVAMTEGHDVATERRISSKIASLRSRVVDACIAGEHAYKTALLEQRHAIEVAVMLREAARADRLFGLIRWCDDWIDARRPLVSRVEAQTAWFERTPVSPTLTGSPRRDEPSST